MSQHWLPRGGLNMQGFGVGGPGRPSICSVFPGLKIGDATKIYSKTSKKSHHLGNQMDLRGPSF